MSDDDRTTTSSNPEVLDPVDSAKEPLVWEDGNMARILGLLFELWQFMERHGILQTYVKKYSRVLSNGKSVSTDLSVAPLVLGLVQEPNCSLLPSRSAFGMSSMR